VGTRQGVNAQERLMAISLGRAEAVA
jgi:hypothetical protein